MSLYPFSSFPLSLAFTHFCQAVREMTRIDDEYTADITAVSQRIAALVQFDLEPVEYAIIEVLQRSKCFTPKQLMLLAFLEQQYGIV